MKLSISWIFYHIDADWKKIDIKNLIDLFNKTTAEIESYKKIETDLNKLFVARVSSVGQETVLLNCPELKKEIELPKRENIKINDNYLIVNQENRNFEWSRASDLGSSKDFLLPKLSIDENDLLGNWKKSFEVEDYVIEIDNKSITHRPDLWGHRGIAREISAILDLKLLPFDKYIEKRNILNFEKQFKSSGQNPFSSHIESDLCKRLATLYISEIENKASILPTITRLVRVDAKPINAIVDATNYVMFDIGQPMHAFDANKIKGKEIFARLAKKGEKLQLLDEEIIELTGDDLVISDAQGPIALAGIMGGKNTQVDENTSSLLIESANFDAATIRKSSIRFKKRTEASARFEKSLDPNQNISAIERYLKILKFAKSSFKTSDEIISLGKEEKEKAISVSLDFIQTRLGIEVKPDFIESILKKLDFKIHKQDNIFKIVVPTFRSTKDVTIQEDIVEEVGRFVGYGTIPLIVPSKQMIPTNVNDVVKIRKIKQLMAYSCLMHEVQNYPFYDETFLKEINWLPENSILMANPISENWQRLVTSLIPHLLKNIQQNLPRFERVNFFEFNRIWSKDNQNTIEKKSLAGIFFDAKKEVDFYNGKFQLNRLFDLLNINIQWVKSDNPDIWYNKQQSAKLIFENHNIGTAGKISKEFLSRITQGDAFIFELDADFLMKYIEKPIKFKSLSKYPIVTQDVSILISNNFNIDELKKIINSIDNRIYNVELIDSFEKSEWLNKISLTFRFNLIDENKTLSKDEINTVVNNIINKLTNIGAQIR